MVYQMDVKSAFLYKTIEEEVYVYQPPGFKDPDYPDKVYKVVKALYGLHQAPRAWYETLANYLLENGFQRGKIDQNLFIKKQKGDILLVQVYVYDIIFGSTNKELCKTFEKLMKDKFQMSSMGELTFFRITINTLIDTEKPLLKDPDGEAVDVHIYSMVRNVDSPSKFLMYLRFIQVMINAQVDDLSSYNTKYTPPALTQKVFSNMRRIGKGFSGVDTPLFDDMLVQQVQDDVTEVKEDKDDEVSTAPTPPSPTPATTPPPPQQEPIPSPPQAQSA
uniref:Putative ribonuclease H-like domain-containing protein n=1 Tax=Tanacetum cinerariifolium TaxID=118510 RepID=A0A6L2NWV9_TANCI|nr:putative ribonuclease H-like domain-containing protein [Tanacetum cinerariifolium]